MRLISLVVLTLCFACSPSDSPDLTMEECLSQPLVNDNTPAQYDTDRHVCVRTCTLGCEKVTQHATWRVGCEHDWWTIRVEPVECLPPPLTMTKCLADPSHTHQLVEKSPLPHMCERFCAMEGRYVTEFASYSEDTGCANDWWFVDEGPYQRTPN